MFATFGLMAGWLAWGCWGASPLRTGVILAIGGYTLFAVSIAAALQLCRLLPSRARSYTLVELLVVTAIIGVLLGAGVPAFVKMAKGSGVPAAANALAGKLNACRSEALSLRRCVALVLPSDEDGVPDSLRRCAYRPAVVSLNAGVWEFVRWTSEENWRRFGSGAVWSSASNAKAVSGCSFSDMGAGSVDIQTCIVFQPIGSSTGIASIDIAVSEGSFSQGEIQGANSANSVTVRVIPFRGLVQVMQ